MKCFSTGSQSFALAFKSQMKFWNTPISQRSSVPLISEALNPPSHEWISTSNSIIVHLKDTARHHYALTCDAFKHSSRGVFQKKKPTKSSHGEWNLQQALLIISFSITHSSNCALRNTFSSMCPYALISWALWGKKNKINKATTVPPSGYFLHIKHVTTFHRLSSGFCDTGNLVELPLGQVIRKQQRDTSG